MAKCANCRDTAVYAYKVSESVSIDYCASHLPKFLASQKAAGLLTPVAEVVEEPIPTTTKSKKKTVVVDAPVVDETAAADATN